MFDVLFQGMHLNGDLLNDVAQVHGDGHVRPLEIDLINLRRQVQTTKQTISQEKQSLAESLERIRPPEVSAVLIPNHYHRINAAA